MGGHYVLIQYSHLYHIITQENQALTLDVAVVDFHAIQRKILNNYGEKGTFF